MTAYNYTQPPDATIEQNGFHGPNAYFTLNEFSGVIPYCTRYMLSGSTALLFIQTNRKLVSDGIITTAGNYTISAVSGGGSVPSVVSANFITGKNYIQLNLSGALDPGTRYVLKTATNTFKDEITAYNIESPVPIFLNASPTQSGITQTINVGSPAMSHT